MLYKYIEKIFNPKETLNLISNENIIMNIAEGEITSIYFINENIKVQKIGKMYKILLPEDKENQYQEITITNSGEAKPIEVKLINKILWVLTDNHLI